MGWRDGQGGGMMQPQSSLSGFRGGANPLAGTGGVRSPSGPYGPPGFLGGPQNTVGPGGMYAGGPSGTYMNQSLPTGGAEPFPTGSSTTGGVGTTMQPNGYIPPGVPPGTGGIKPPPGSVGSPDIGYLTPDTMNLPTNPAWFSSPQGLAQQAAMAQRLTRGMGPGTLGQTHERVVPGSGPTQGYTSPNAAMRGMGGAERSAYIEAQRAGQPRTWYAKELAAAGLPWQGMSDYAQMQAWLNTLPPDQRQSYIDAQKAVGLDFTMPAPTGGGTGPFGN